MKMKNTIEQVKKALNTMTPREFQNASLQNSADVFGTTTENEFLATEEFWSLWNTNSGKESIKAAGISVAKCDDSGIWFVSVPEIAPKTETVNETPKTETAPETHDNTDEFVGEKAGIKVVKRDENSGMGRSTITRFFFIHPDGREEKVGSVAVSSVRKKVENFLS